MKIYKPEESGNRIKALRKQMKLTQEELADKIGISREYLGRVERGQNGLSIDLALELSDVLGVGVEDILAIEGNRCKLADDIYTAIVKVLDENRLFTKCD